MGVSIKDIASDTGLSIVTVSKYLNGKSISEQSRERIEESISRLNYIPNMNARLIRDTKTNIVAIFTAGYDSMFWGDLISRIAEDLSRLGYVPMLIEFDYGNEPISKLQNYMRMNYAGVIVIPKRDYDRTIRFFLDKKIPSVIIDKKVAGFRDVNLITSSNYDAGYMMASYLIGHGHKVIGCVCADMTASSIYSRYEGFKAAVVDNGLYLGEEYFAQCEFSFQSAREASRQIMSCSPVPTAMASLSDDVALGTISMLSELGYSIGKDMSFIAMDDNEIYDSLDPPITACEQNKSMIAHTAVSTLYSMMNSSVSSNDFAEILIPPFMKERSSVIDLNTQKEKK